MAKRVVVAGGGISGLSAALQLIKHANHKVVLVEKEETVGGYMKTKKIGNSWIDSGPRSIRVVGGDKTLEVVKEIGLDPVVASGIGKQRFIYFSRTENESPIVHCLPSSLENLSERISAVPMWKEMILTQLRRSFTGTMKDSGIEGSIHEFLTKQFGEQFANKIGASVILGIFAGDSRLLSMRDCFIPMYNAFKDCNNPSFIRGMISNILNPKKLDGNQEIASPIDPSDPLHKIGAYSFQQGIQQLPKTIVSHMQEKYKDRFEILCGSEISALEASGDSMKLNVSSKTGNFDIKADHVICTLPSFTTAKLLKKENSEVSGLLDSIQYVNVAVINLIWDTPIHTGYNGFGYLVAPETSNKIMGTTFDSQIFPSLGDESQTRMTVMMGGDISLGFDVKKYSHEELTQIAIDTIHNHLDFTEMPNDVICNVHEKCIPQYYVGHHATVEKLDSMKEKLFRGSSGEPMISIGGNYMKGVSINSCVTNGSLLASEYLKRSQ